MALTVDLVIYERPPVACPVAAGNARDDLGAEYKGASSMLAFGNWNV